MTTLTLAAAKFETKDYLRSAMRLAWIAIPLMILLPLHLVWQTLQLPSPWARLFLRISTRALGMQIKVYGKPLRKDVFFVANHISWHDIAILGGLTGTAFVAQDGVRSWPVIGWLAAQNRTVFVSRTDKQNVASQISELRAAIAENWSVTLFAEGTTSDGRGLLPMKPSLFAALTPMPKPVMIQPVLLDFGKVGPDIAWLGEETGWESALRALMRPGTYHVDVHYLEAFDPGLLADRKAICAKAREHLAAALSERLGYRVS